MALRNFNNGDRLLDVRNTITDNFQELFDRVSALESLPIPTPTAMMTKYMGNDLAIAPIASAEILPANQVSTKL